MMNYWQKKIVIPAIPRRSTLEDEQVLAREAFDTALASGATPEEAMAEAAAVTGFSEPESSSRSSPTENDVFNLTDGGDIIKRRTIPGVR